MISGKEEDLNKELIERFSNANLIVEESRKSRLTRDEFSRIKKIAFDSDAHQYYSTLHLSLLLRKSMYQMNFDSGLQSQLFRAINALLCELYHVKDKSRLLKEAEEEIQNLFDLMSFLGQSEADGFLHDETSGGWHHPHYPGKARE
ncbi:hypothetical protein D3C71_1317310 [compost metagenome]